MLRDASELIKEIRNVYNIAGFKTGSEFLLGLARNAPSVFSDRSLGSVDRTMSRSYYEFRAGGRAFFVPADAFGVAREIIGREIYSLDSRFAISPGDHVIDLGANIGVFSMAAARCGANVLAIEAQSEFVAEMAKLLQLNDITTVLPLHGIVAPSGGVFSSSEQRAVASHWKVEPREIDLDAVLQEIRWPQVDFLKADIEGAEFALFASGGNWLTRVRRMAMEVHAEFGSVSALVSHLESRGFDVTLTDLRKHPVSRLSGAMGYVYAVRM